MSRPPIDVLKIFAAVFRNKTVKSTSSSRFPRHSTWKRIEDPWAGRRAKGRSGAPICFSTHLRARVTNAVHDHDSRRRIHEAALLEGLKLVCVLLGESYRQYPGARDSCDLALGNALARWHWRGQRTGNAAESHFCNEIKNVD